MNATTWEPIFQTSISAYADGDMAAGRAACDRLLSLSDVPEEYRASARSNAFYYAPILSEDVQGYRDWAIEISLPEGWSAFNPSLVADGGGYLLSARLANYTMPGWVLAPGDVRYRSLAALVPLDEEGKQAGPAEVLTDETLDEREQDDRYAGVEDLRLIRRRGRLFASGSAVRRMRADQRIVAFGVFEIDRSRGVIGNPRWLSDGRGSLTEKNWMPVSEDGAALRFIYSSGPTAVVRVEDDAPGLALETCVAAPPLAAWFRGGTQAIPHEDGWIALVHESVDDEEGYRDYLHRIVRYGADFAITHLSHPFQFHGERIEFAGGLARCGSDLLIAFGLADRECRVAAVPEQTLLSLLRPAEAFLPDGPGSAEVPVTLAPLLQGSHRAPGSWPQTWDAMLSAPAFVINLDRTPERFGPAMERIRAAGFRDVRRVRGVDGQSASELAEGWASFGNPWLRRGAFGLLESVGHQGAFLSHAGVWRAMIEQDIPVATIFEDDVVFHPRWDDLAPERYAATPEGVEVIWLGSNADTAPEPGRPLLRVPVSGLYAVMLTQDGARRLLEIALNRRGGAIIVDQAIREWQRAALGRGEEAAWWVAWSALDTPDPANPPIHIGGVLERHGLVDASRTVASATEPDFAWPSLFRQMVDGVARGDLAGAALARDRLSTHLGAPAAVRRIAHEEVIRVARSLEDAVPGARLLPAPRDAFAPDATPIPLLSLRAGAPVLLEERLGAFIATPVGPDGPFGGSEPVSGLTELAGLSGVRIGAGVARSLAMATLPDGRIAALDLDAGLSAIRPAYLMRGLPLVSPAAIPVMLGRRPALIASFDPVALFERGDNGAFRERTSVDAPAFLTAASDATGATPWDEGMLAMVRMAAGDWYGQFVHRFLEFGLDGVLRKLSGPLLLRMPGDERSGGVVVTGEHVLLTVRSQGTDWLAALPAAGVRELLLPLSAFLQVDRGEGGAIVDGVRRVSLESLSRRLDAIAGEALRSALQ